MSKLHTEWKIVLLWNQLRYAFLTIIAITIVHVNESLSFISVVRYHLRFHMWSYVLRVLTLPHQWKSLYSPFIDFGRLEHVMKRSQLNLKEIYLENHIFKTSSFEVLKRLKRFSKAYTVWLRNSILEIGNIFLKCCPNTWNIKYFFFWIVLLKEWSKTLPTCECLLSQHI